MLWLVAFLAAFLMAAPATGRQAQEQALAAAVAERARGDHAAAIARLRPLARQDMPQAETLLGLMTAAGEGVRADPAVAAGWFLRAARRGYPPAQLALAHAHWTGTGVAPDRARALALAEAAAAAGQPGAAVLVSRLSADQR